MSAWTKDDIEWRRLCDRLGDPTLAYTDEDWQVLYRHWLADMARLGMGELESELEYATRRLIEIRLNPDFARGAIDGVYYEPDLQQRSAWLAWEIQRRRALPEQPKGSTWRIPASFVEDLKKRLDLPAFLTRTWGLALTQRGQLWVGLCPYHTEKTPSFTVWNDHAFCFGCQHGGDVLDLLLESSDCQTWREAVEFVAEYLHVQVPRPPEPLVQHVAQQPPTRILAVPTL